MAWGCCCKWLLLLTNCASSSQAVPGRRVQLQPELRACCVSTSLPTSVLSCQDPADR